MKRLRHFFRKHPGDDIRESWCMRPCPDELSLQDDI